MPSLFTRDEAERMLPQIVPLLQEIRSLKRLHDAHALTLARVETQTKTNGHGTDVDVALAKQGQQAAALAINGTIERINALGAEVKDIDTGLIDFRSQMGDRVVYLCWKLGEEGIAWWHELDTGFASRQPLD